MKEKKCLCCFKVSRITILNQSINLCPVCSHVVSNKMNCNYQNNKSIKVLNIIKEINNWDDKDLYNAHLSLMEKE